MLYTSGTFYKLCPHLSALENVVLMIFLCVASVLHNPFKFVGLVHCCLLGYKPRRMDVCSRKREERERGSVKISFLGFT